MTLDPSRKSATFRGRLLSKIYPQPGGCWLWSGKPNSSGYGRITVGPWGAGEILAHRATYEEFVGPIPDGLVIDHLCLVRLCVNPEHLEPVTPSENSLRCAASVAGKLRAMDRCAKGHEFTQLKDQRRCITCTRETERRRRRRKAAAQ